MYGAESVTTTIYRQFPAHLGRAWQQLHDNEILNDSSQMSD